MLAFGGKAMTNLGSVLKSRDITLPTKVHIVKAMVFPTASYGFPISVDGKESACSAGDQDLILVGKMSWRREWQPTPGFLPREFHGQNSLAGYSPWGCKELDIPEHVSLSLFQGASIF